LTARSLLGLTGQLSRRPMPMHTKATSANRLLANRSPRQRQSRQYNDGDVEVVLPANPRRKREIYFPGIHRARTALRPLATLHLHRMADGGDVEHARTHAPLSNRRKIIAKSVVCRNRCRIFAPPAGRCTACIKIHPVAPALNRSQ